MYDLINQRGNLSVATSPTLNVNYLKDNLLPIHINVSSGTGDAGQPNLQTLTEMAQKQQNKTKLLPVEATEQN